MNSNSRSTNCPCDKYYQWGYRFCPMCTKRYNYRNSYLTPVQAHTPTPIPTPTPTPTPTTSVSSNDNNNSNSKKIGDLICCTIGYLADNIREQIEEQLAKEIFMSDKQIVIRADYGGRIIGDGIEGTLPTGNPIYLVYVSTLKKDKMTIEIEVNDLYRYNNLLMPHCTTLIFNRDFNDKVTLCNSLNLDF